MRNSRKLTHRALALSTLMLCLVIAGWQAPALMAYSNQMVKAVRSAITNTPAKSAEFKASAAPVATMQQLTKEQKHARMKELLTQIASVKGQPGQQATLNSALAELKQISDSMGGDLPAAVGPAAPSQTAVRVIPPVPSGCTLSNTTATQSTPTAIPTGPAVVTSTLVVAGAGPYLWDVDLTTNLTHTFVGDLDITIQSPAGTVVTLTTDNGGDNDNVFNGTLWDDQANPAGQVPYTSNNGLVTDHAYVNLTLASPLVPEEALSAFRGENPNGTWTITISDDLAGDGGSLDSWSLALSTLPAAPITSTNNFSQLTPTAIPTGPAVVSSTVAVAGAGTALFTVKLRTSLTHTYAADLDITLQSPAGTVVTLTTDNGADNDNTFNGTIWDDDANPAGQVPYTTNNGLATDHAYVNLTTASPLAPEEALGAFSGENPNGTWTITISDDLAGDGGSLDSWTLEVTTMTCVLPCSLTCPANITVSNDPNQCGAVVNYPAPTTTGTCGTVTCSPASGSFFPKGTTTVTCTATGAPMPTCTFTVTVNDTQPPAITCPANIAVGTTGASAVVSFTTTASDNCPGVTVACTPPSGSSFNVGTTTVTCTATDASGNTATCSFTVNVLRVSFSLSDPLACTGPGNAVTGTFSITNSGGAVAASATVTLPSGLVGVPGSCVTNTGSCAVVNPSLVSFTGTIGAGQTATVSYTAQVGDLVAPGTILCSLLQITFGASPPFTVQACITATCPAPGPGGLYPAGSEVSDQKAGSVLIYNVYTSGATSGNTQNTRINITNVHPVLPSFVHLFFVAEGCAVADSYICLTGNQTSSFLASDLDPGTTGYIVAIAVDAIGCPTNFNYLIGDEYVKFTSGHAANLGAEAFAALPGGLPFCNANSVTATINFDGFSYNRAPRTVALSSVGSRADGNDTLLILNRIGGNLGIGAATLGPIFGIFYDDAENSLSFSFSGNCQFRSSISNNFPRLTPRFETFVPAGRTGWLKLFSQSDIGILGAAINFNPNAASSAGAFNQGHNLHKLTLSSAASYVIPLFPPSC